MLRGVLLILLFLLCAWIMKIFVKLVDRFIVRSVIPEEYRERSKCIKKEYTSMGEEPGVCAEISQESAPDSLDRAAEETAEIYTEGLAFPTKMLDKLRRKSKVKHNRDGNTVQIGTARPTQIRIHHYE